MNLSERNISEKVELISWQGTHNDMMMLDRLLIKRRITGDLYNSICMAWMCAEKLFEGLWDIQFRVKPTMVKKRNVYGVPTWVDSDTMWAFASEYGFDPEADYHPSPYLRTHRLNPNNVVENYVYYENRVRRMGEMPAVEYEDAVGVSITGAYLIIHFPEVTLSNSDRLKMDIKDLFIRLTFAADGHISDIKGTRSTFTPAEAKGGYLHSHLTKRELFKDEKMFGQFLQPILDYSKFCLGSGQIRDHSSLYNHKRLEEDMMSILLLCNSLASWESIEGTPHYSMEHIADGNREMHNVKENESNAFWNSFRLRRLPDTRIKWTIEDGRYKVIDNEALDAVIREWMNANSYNTNKVVVYKREDGSFFRKSEISANIQIRPHPEHRDYVPFKGKRIPFKLEGELRIVDDLPKYLHPVVKQYFIKQMEYHVNKFQARLNIFERVDQSTLA